MGCSSSKPERTSEGPSQASSMPGSRLEVAATAAAAAAVPAPGDGRKRPSTKVFDSHTTEASSNLGFRGSGPSFHSLPSTSESFARSDGGGSSDMGSMSLFSASSKRSIGGFGVGEKLSELSDEEGFEEDFEDTDEGERRDSGARAGDRPTPLRAADSGEAPVSRCVRWLLVLLQALSLQEFSDKGEPNHLSTQLKPCRRSHSLTLSCLPSLWYGVLLPWLSFGVPAAAAAGLFFVSVVHRSLFLHDTCTLVST